VVYLLVAAGVVASYCAVVWLAYGVLAFYGAPLAGDEPLRWLGGLPRTYLFALARVPAQLVGAVALLVAGIVLAVSAWRTWQLRDGGDEVARWLGARRIDPERCAPNARKLLNVVGEMAIASGVREPPVYLLESETAVNALVAGHSPDDAAIIVTRGAVDLLSREELQGVIGHEFSHILNGDMALNLRLSCLLAGLSWIGQCGEEMFWRDASFAYHARGGSTAGPIALLGVLLAFIGFPGVLAADAVKAAISRERELLADAASVQFTRNPDGIAGALDSILALRAHTSVLAIHALEFSHMFFAPLAGRWWGFATHPSIDERIAAVHPGFDRPAYRERLHGVRRQVAVLDGGGDVVAYR
jgi:Zn-dependent protease with chaperone function